jgi:hypothetical protein
MEVGKSLTTFQTTSADAEAIENNPIRQPRPNRFSTDDLLVRFPDGICGEFLAWMQQFRGQFKFKNLPAPAGTASANPF